MRVWIKSINTSIVVAGDGHKTFLPCSIPDLELAYFIVNFEHSEPEIDADGGEVVFDEIIITESEKERGFADALVSD